MSHNKPFQAFLQLVLRPVFFWFILFLSSIVVASEDDRPDFLQQVYGNGAPYLYVEKVWIEHDTHKTVEPWWEKGTQWEGKPAMTIYTKIVTRNLKDQELNVQISFHDAISNTIRWTGMGGFHWTGKDGLLKAWWTDRPPTDDFTYQAFRIPIPYEAFDVLSMDASTLTVRAEVWAPGIRTSGQALIDSLPIRQRAMPATATQVLSVLADKNGETHARLELNEIQIQPAVIKSGAGFSLVTRYTLSDKTTRQSQIPVRFSYRILKDGQPVFSQPATLVNSENGKTTTVTRDGLQATTLPGNYDIEVKLETDWSQQTGSASFEVR